MSRYYLLKFEMNYCDEFDVMGFSVLTQDELFKVEISRDKHNNDYDDIYLGFGTNEAIECSYSDALEAISTDEISENEYKILIKLFGKNYGLITPVMVYNY